MFCYGLVICFVVYSLVFVVDYIIIVLFGGLVATHFTIIINIMFGCFCIFYIVVLGLFMLLVAMFVLGC